MKLHKLNWARCNCGSRYCKKQYPTNLGDFYQGSGFMPDEVALLDRAFSFMEQAESKGVTSPTSEFETRLTELMEHQTHKTNPEVILAGCLDTGFRVGVEKISTERSVRVDYILVGIVTGLQLIAERSMDAAANTNELQRFRQDLICALGILADFCKTYTPGEENE